MVLIRAMSLTLSLPPARVRSGAFRGIPSGEFDERKKGWKRCACQIFASGTLAGKFKRKYTGKSDWDEAFVTNGAPLPDQTRKGEPYRNHLYRNNCDMTFTDVTDKAGLAGDGLSGNGYAMGVAAADYDNDGFVDLFVTGLEKKHPLPQPGRRYF